MTLYAEVARRFIIEKVRKIHDEATAKNQSALQKALQRDIEYSKWKCDALMNFKQSIDTIDMRKSDAEYKQTLLAEVGSIQSLIGEKRREGNHPSGYTEQGLNCINDFITRLFNSFQSFKLIDYTTSEEPLYFYYKTMALYFAKRVQDAAEATQDISFFSVQKITNNPRISVKPAFLAKLDTLVQTHLSNTQDNIEGQRIDDEGFARRKNTLARDMFELLSHRYTALRYEHGGSAGIYAALLPDDFSIYIAEGRKLLNPETHVMSVAISNQANNIVVVAEDDIDAEKIECVG